VTAPLSSTLPRFSAFARARATLLAGLLGLAIPASAQVIIANLDDECVENPDEGIFCQPDPQSDFFRVFSHIISGDTTEGWSDSVTAGDYNHGGTSYNFFDYTLTEGSRLTIVGSGSMHYRGTIQGAGALRLVSGYSLTFEPSNQHVYTLRNPPYTSYHLRNTHSGGTDIDGGWLKIYDDASLGTGALTLRNGGRLDLLAAGSFRGFTLGGDATLLFSNFDTTVAGVISGDGRLNKSGTGTLTLTAENTYTGGTHVAEGTLAVSTDANLGAADTRVSLANGTTLALGDAFSSSQRELAIEGTAANVSVATGNATWNGVISGTGGLTKAGGGTLTLTGANTYSGGTTVAAGTLRAGAANTSGSLAGSVVNNATLAFNRSDASTYSGVISGSGAVTKLGAGTLTLSGTNTYNGATMISAGTLNLSGSAANSAFTVAGGTLSGSGTLGALTIDSGGTLAPGNSPGMLHAGATTFAGGGSYLWEINDANGAAGAATGWDLLSISGGLTITSTSANRFTIDLTSLASGNAAGAAAGFSPTAPYFFTLVSTTTGITGFSSDKFLLDTSAFANSFTGTWDIALANGGNDLALTYTGISAIPEPSTYALLAGLAALGVVTLRRRALR